MRLDKKVYYHKQIEEHQNNTQGLWKVLNSIIKKVLGNSNDPHYFIKKNQPVITKTKETANELNNYFVNVGYNLEIVEPKVKNYVNESIINTNPNTNTIPTWTNLLADRCPNLCLPLPGPMPSRYTPCPNYRH